MHAGSVGTGDEGRGFEVMEGCIRTEHIDQFPDFS